MIKLSKRLAAVAAYAEKGKKIADIGADHGYIPVYLAQLGAAEKITAADINPGPLSKARESAEAYGVGDKLDFKLTDGLDGLDPVYDTVIIAGMGGETIMGILAAAPWTKNGVSLILQPQSKQPELIEWLYENGYMVEDESLVLDAGKLYRILKVKGGEAERPGPEELIAGRRLFEKRDPLLKKYLENLRKKFRYAILGMEKAADGGIESQSGRKMLELIDGLLEECEKW